MRVAMTSPGLLDAPPMGPAQLQGPVRDAEPLGGALEASLFQAGRAANGTILRGPADFLETGTHQHRPLDHSLEASIDPHEGICRAQRALLLRRITDADHAIACASV